MQEKETQVKMEHILSKPGVLVLIKKSTNWPTFVLLMM